MYKKKKIPTRPNRYIEVVQHKKEKDKEKDNIALLYKDSKHKDSKHKEINIKVKI